jgi:hypothetical protein
MKTIKDYKMNNTQNFNGTVIPIFLPTSMEQPMASSDLTQLNKQAELSIFDVKELYDLAYDFETSDKAKFKTLLAEAVKLDMAYRYQLTQKSSFKDKTKQKSFNTAGNATQAA